MTPSEWDAHKAKYCAKCEYSSKGVKVCTILSLVDVNPDNYTCGAFFVRYGRCSQFRQKIQSQRRR